MSSKRGDVKFKYVNAIPSRVSAGTFYWKYENNVNQLYFSPTENGEDILRLDNIISGEGGSSISSDVSLVGIYDPPSSEKQIVINQNNGTVTSWSDEDWESYMQMITMEGKYGKISEKVFLKGNVIICGSREFICRESVPVFFTVKIDGIDYYKSIRVDIRKALPDWPLGLADNRDTFLCSALKTDKKAYLAVWRRDKDKKSRILTAIMLK